MFRCKQSGCERTDRGSHGWCVLHYHRYYHGRKMDAKPILRGAPSMTRFMSHVEKSESGCWLWTANKIHSGYGMFKVGGKSRLAHKWIYEQLHGPVKAPLQLDHTCAVKHCVNPKHLEKVTAKENIRRFCERTGKKRKTYIPHPLPLKTHCPKGHPYSGDNLRMLSPTHKQCVTCHREATRKYYWRTKHGRAAPNTR